MKKYKKYIYAAIAIVIIGGIWQMSKGTAKPDYDLGTVQRSDIVQEVSVTGKVKADEDRNLSFERSGKVSRVYVSVGDTVTTGDALVSLDTTELQAHLGQAQASLDAERSMLAELTVGTREEELKIAQTSVDNASRTLAAAQASLAATKEKADADIHSVYDGTVTALQSSVVNAKNALVTLTDIQEAHFDNFDQQSAQIAQNKAAVAAALFGQDSSGYWEAEFISELDGGLFGEVSGLTDSLDTEKIDAYLVQVIKTQELLRDALNSVPIVSEMTTIEKTNLTSEKTIVSSEISILSGKEQSIAVQQALNKSATDTARSAVTAAENTLRQTQDQLALKQSGSTEEKKVTQEARVRAQESAVSLYQTQIAKSTLRTPIAGSVTTQDAREGVVVSAGSPIVSVMSLGNYEIEAFIPEADIVKVEIGDIAHVTLDAYSDDTVIEATVIAIDPAETVVEGVPTYKTTFLITQGSELVKSGMTANIDVVTQTKTGVLNVPTRAVVTKDGEKFIREVDAVGEIQMIPVTVGLRGSNGQIEIIDGVKEGQEIITFMDR